MSPIYRQHRMISIYRFEFHRYTKLSMRIDLHKLNQLLSIVEVSKSQYMVFDIDQDVLQQRPALVICYQSKKSLFFFLLEEEYLIFVE